MYEFFPTANGSISFLALYVAFVLVPFFNPVVSATVALKYSFVFPQTRMKTYVEGKCTYLKAYNTDAYLKGDAYTTVMLIVGVDF